jgi:hypothetical protein
VRARTTSLLALAAPLLALATPLLAPACAPPAAAPSAPSASASATEAPPPRRVKVEANKPASRVGRYAKGTRVALKPISGSWRAGKDAPSLGAEGDPRKLCLGDESHHCIGGDGLFARMSLVVLVSACDVYQPGCPILAREYVGAGATFEMPVDGELWLGPNDWVEELGDNDGAVEVEIVP